MHNDLRTIRKDKRLTIEDLAALAGLRSATLQEIETGKRCPQVSTRHRIERLLGSEINWLTTLAQDRGHIGYALKELLNMDHPGADERIKFCRQYLYELEKMMRHATTE